MEVNLDWLCTPSHGCYMCKCIDAVSNEWNGQHIPPRDRYRVRDFAGRYIGRGQRRADQARSCDGRLIYRKMTLIYVVYRTPRPTRDRYRAALESVMPVYRLHVIYDGREADPDIEGAEFHDGVAAITEAHRGLRELVAFAIQTACEAPTAIQVTDNEGAKIALIARRDLIPSVWFSVQ